MEKEEVQEETAEEERKDPVNPNTWEWPGNILGGNIEKEEPIPKTEIEQEPLPAFEQSSLALIQPETKVEPEPQAPMEEIVDVGSGSEMPPSSKALVPVPTHSLESAPLTLEGEPKTRRPKTGPRASGPLPPLCQVDGCKADLSGSKEYHKRHKVCEMHSKAATVLLNDQSQRFCQQCSR